MEIREGSLLFKRTIGSGPQKASAQIAFPREVASATVVMAGYTANFEDDDRGREFGRLIVRLDSRVVEGKPSRVEVSGELGLRDGSGQWDDAYGGMIDFIVLAQLVPLVAAPGRARRDLLVVGAELTQAIQHFRSSQHLDAANQFPDNSIRLVASKPTAVRLYVDYDPASGLAPIARLRGVLTVSSGGTLRQLAPLRAIAPRRDSTIERGEIGDTLNFVIPEELCRGTVRIQAEVFDEDDPTQFSKTFTTSARFNPRPVLPIMAVGIEYTGPDVKDADALAAPDRDDFDAVLGLTETLFPIPGFEITSKVDITYDKEVNSDISVPGCDKMGWLKQAVAEMAGDSDDIVLGLYNRGVDTGTVGGCGGNMAAVHRIGRDEGVAHEIGHALGRGHAPCDNQSRCADPQNQDPNYPDYSGYDSDSIGEFGFDTRNGGERVVDPAVSHDIMGYSKPDRWISPYTYKALMSRIPERFGSSSGGGDGAEFFSLAAPAPPLDDEDRGCWIPIKQPMLFLRIDIHRDRRVDFDPAFHFPARPRPHGLQSTDFLSELQDEKGRALGQACLYSDASCCDGCGGSWPLRIRQAVAFVPEARSLVLFECDKEIARWPVLSPPKVGLAVEGGSDRERDEIEISWQATKPRGLSGDLWYLVQWRDRFDSWRGLAPRTRATRQTVPKRIFAGERRSFVRVLASGGIATGEAVWEGEILQAGGRRRPQVAIGLAGVSLANAGTTFLPPLLKAVVGTASGASASFAKLRWYDGNGAELARGRRLDLAGLPVGRHQVTARAADTGVGEGTASWLIERRTDGRFVLLGGGAPSSAPTKTEPTRQKEK